MWRTFLTEERSIARSKLSNKTMINVAVLCTVVLVGLTLLIGVAILLYQQYKFRRKSIDWGDIGRYDTPLEIPTGSNNSSFRSYKYSQLVGKYSEGQQRKQSNSHLYPDQRQSLSLSDIERDGRARGNHSSIKSCPPGVFTTTKQVQIILRPKEPC